MNTSLRLIKVFGWGFFSSLALFYLVYKYARHSFNMRDFVTLEVFDSFFSSLLFHLHLYITR